MGLGGSISAEHGVGLQKVKYLSMQKDQATLELMGQLKRLFDDRSILNPHKVVALK